MSSTQPSFRTRGVGALSSRAKLALTSSTFDKVFSHGEAFPIISSLKIGVELSLQQQHFQAQFKAKFRLYHQQQTSKEKEICSAAPVCGKEDNELPFYSRIRVQGAQKIHLGKHRRRKGLEKKERARSQKRSPTLESRMKQNR